MSAGKKFFPLRPIQRWLIDTHFNKAKSTMMNIGALLKLSSAVDMEFLAEVLNDILKAHDIFSCRLEVNPETSDICQTFNNEIIPVKVKNISDEEFSARLEKFKEPYKLINQPLYRIYLFETPTAKYLYLDFYHAIMDGASLLILFAKEMDLRYRGRKILHAPQSYAQFILEEAQISPEELSEGHAYWKNILSKFDAKKHLPPIDVKGGKAWAKGNFKVNLKNISEEFFRNSHRSENTFFLAASMLTLAKISAANESIIFMRHNGRINKSELRLMGLMLEQFPCIWDFRADCTVEKFLNELEGEIRKNFNYRQSLDIVYSEGLGADCATFIFQKNIFAEHIMIGDSTAQIIDMPPNEISAAENSLDIQVKALEDGTYNLILDYDAGRFSAQLMKNFAAMFDKNISELKNLNSAVRI